VPGRLVPGDGNAPGFDDKSLAYDASTRFNFVRLPDPHRSEVGLGTLASNAHHRRLLTAAAWSGLKSAPESRLRRACLHLSRSLYTVRLAHLAPSFLCACGALSTAQPKRDHALERQVGRGVVRRVPRLSRSSDSGCDLQGSLWASADPAVRWPEPPLPAHVATLARKTGRGPQGAPPTGTGFSGHSLRLAHSVSS